MGTRTLRVDSTTAPPSSIRVSVRGVAPAGATRPAWSFYRDAIEEEFPGRRVTAQPREEGQPTRRAVRQGLRAPARPPRRSARVVSTEAPPRRRSVGGVFLGSAIFAVSSVSSAIEYVSLDACGDAGSRSRRRSGRHRIGELARHGAAPGRVHMYSDPAASALAAALHSSPKMYCCRCCR